jgi:hypothetical protein
LTRAAWGWSKALASQQRVTARFQSASGATLHVRKVTISGAEMAAIYRALGLDSQPSGTWKHDFRPERDL